MKLRPVPLRNAFIKINPLGREFTKTSALEAPVSLFNMESINGV